MTTEQLAVHTIRTLSMDAVQKANSGHPGMPMGMADAAYVLFHRFLRVNPENPSWFNRDRFVLSAGHGSMLQYSLLHLLGFELSIDDLKQFRQWGSKTPGHPEFGHTSGVETTTGPLGQGFATGVGMAIAEAFLAATFNRPGFNVVDHLTFAIAGDGDLMEGISHEAASMAGHLKLGKLIYLWDNNRISIDGSTDLSFTEDVLKRFESYGWQTISIDGHDRNAVEKAIMAGISETERPTLISCRTHIGYGSPKKQDSAEAHGSPLGPEEIKAAKSFYGVDPDLSFYVAEEVYSHFANRAGECKILNNRWNSLLDSYASAYPELNQTLQSWISGELPSRIEQDIPVFAASEKGMATRKASGNVIQALKSTIGNWVGGSADLTGSTLTFMEGEGVFQSGNPSGRNLHYGVREHAMGAAMNGMALHGGVRPFGATFLVFADYCKPAVRLAALMRIPVTYVFTHDSIGLGEDGPTHQPVEHLLMLRSIPNSLVLRPADANETAYAWLEALKNTTGPTSLALTRQNLPVFNRPDYAPASLVSKGAYVLYKTNETPDIILLASGSEVAIIMQAAYRIEEAGRSVFVVSVPSWELFEKQDAAYKSAVLPEKVTKRVAVEAASTIGWERFTGSGGRIIGMNSFGASAPYEILYKEFGITADAVVKAALAL